MILAANITGRPNPAHAADGDPFWPDAHDRSDFVHVTNLVGLAAGYAGYEPQDAWLYEVAPVDWLTLDPYYLPTGRDHLVCRCQSARIIARYELRSHTARYAHAAAEAHKHLALASWHPRLRVDPPKYPSWSNSQSTPATASVMAPSTPAPTHFEHHRVITKSGCDNEHMLV